MIEVINRYSCLPFRYGADCCTFAAEVIESLTGKNPLQGLSYKTEKEAYQIIRRLGGFESAMRHYLGNPYGGHKDGDVCLIQVNGRQAAAVIHKDSVIARTGGGLQRLPLGRALIVWCT